MKPRITVGLVVKNCENYIADTIKSILDQDLPHQLLEIIVVDGRSTDKTLSIIKRDLAGSQIETNIFFENKGLGVARQIVVDNARGEYILWVDGDMIMSKGFIRKLLVFMDQNARFGIVKGKQALTPAKNVLATLESFSRAASRMVDYESEKGRLKALGTAGSMCRINAVREAGGFDKSLRGYNEDWDMEIRVRDAGWSLNVARAIDAFYLDYERLGLTWKDLWKRYWLRGYYTRCFLRKKKGALKMYTMLPPAAVVSGILSAFTLFKMTRMRIVFLLPFQSMFKMTAFDVGYLRSHMTSYSPP